jgi:DNA transposition AAA+ family ATPase
MPATAAPPKRGRPRKPPEPPPDTGRLSAEQLAILADYVERYHASEQTQAEAAAKIGASAGTLSQIERGTYAGNVAKYIQRMAGVNAREKARALAWKRPPAVVTTVLTKLHGLFEVCRNSCEMGFACTKFGLGKTVAAQEYVRQNADTIMITAIKNMSCRTMLADLGDRIGVVWQGRNDQMVRALVRKLKALGRPLILVDEADFAGPALHILRQFHDLAGCGVVLLGTPAFLERLRRRSTGTEGQVLSRLTHTIYLDSIVEEDAETILAPFGLQPAELSVAWRGCGRNARRLVAIALNAANMARGQGVPIARAHVEAAVDATALVQL